MNILSLLTNHSHYWGIPHERMSDKKIVQTCYECGAEHVIKIDLRPDHPRITTISKNHEHEAA